MQPWHIQDTMQHFERLLCRMRNSVWTAYVYIGLQFFMRSKHVQKQHDVLNVLVCNVCCWLLQNNLRGWISGAIKVCQLHNTIGKLQLDLRV